MLRTYGQNILKYVVYCAPLANLQNLEKAQKASGGRYYPNIRYRNTEEQRW